MGDLGCAKHSLCMFMEIFEINKYITLRTFDALQRVQLACDAMPIDSDYCKGPKFREVLHLHENARRGRLDFHTTHITFFANNYF